MKGLRAAARYAKALFELAKERDEAAVVSRELGALAAICRESPSLREFVPLTDVIDWSPAPKPVTGTLTRER